jgi:outer membrane protein assembly factor BamB
MNRINKQYSVILILLFLLSSIPASGNWPQFRGPENNMIAPGTNYPAEWNDSLNVKWTFDISGESWSSPIIYGDKIFMTTSVKEETAAPTNQQADEHLVPDFYRMELSCIDLKSGKEIWRQTAYHGHPTIKKHARSTYACESPVTDGKRVVAYFGMMGVYCYDLNGTLLWQKDLGVYSTRNNWGTGSSPALYQGTLFIQVDNEDQSFLVALDAATGREKWRATYDDKTNYSTPVIWENAAGIELVTVGKTARSFDPQTGELNWELKIGGQMAVPSPVYNNDFIYLGLSGENYKPGVLYSIKAGAKGDITPGDSALVSNGVEWTLRDAGINSASPLLYDGLLYLVTGRSGELSCIDASSGDLIYMQKIENMRACWASPWAFDNKIFFYDEKGVTRVVQAGRDFKLRAEHTLDDTFWASVAFSTDAYIVKGVKKLYCISK